MGIDYGNGLTNIDHATEIRYGVIHQNEVLQAWCDSAESDYGPPYCPKCQNQANEPSAFGDTFKVDGVVNCHDFEGADEYTDEHHECRDYVCVNCRHFFGSESAFGDEPLGYYYTDEEYRATQTDHDIFVIKSPFYTFAPFCSPCAPGAGYLGSADKVDESSGVKTYCFGHDWFEDGKAPYRVFSVETNEEVLPNV